MSPVVTITALNDPVALVHIPIHLADSYTTKLYWTIIKAGDLSAEFFNVTSNRVEIAVFGSIDLVNEEWSDADQDVRVSGSWRVFEISSGDEGEGGNYDSPHLREVSAPLAKAGISILYQSSYFTDFLLVRSSDFVRASEIFAGQGWHIDPLPSIPRRHSQLLSPTSPSPTRPFPSPTTRISPPPPSQPEITVLSSPLACVGISHSAATSDVAERLRRFIVWPERSVQSSQTSRSRETSPCSDSRDHSTERYGRRKRPRKEESRPFVSYTRTEDGSSLMTETRALKAVFEGQEVDIQSGGEILSDWEDESDLDLSDGESDLEDDEMPRTPVSARSGYFSLHHGVQNQIDENTQTDEHAQTGENSRTGENDGDEIGNPERDNEERTGRKKENVKYEGERNGGKKRFSLPATPGDSPMTIQWTGRVTRSITNRANKEGERGGRKRCLQLDLRGVGSGDEGEGTYHMDKSGLVTRFSSLLNTAQIKMLYSSTMHTANVLVEARDVRRAKSLLERGGRQVSPCSVL
ncbi:hypothetical protein M231_06958 [Tremella mesenterica]|uniref:CASTOR ACT domain-containing protein n=1 Tax=Tremella mesenterica TaxID=5217 RepID=A0A4Q1BAG3_TREME|nr:hypothetical protein M231_06958 [Tremella mesenterica]